MDTPRGGCSLPRLRRGCLQTTRLPEGAQNVIDGYSDAALSSFRYDEFGALLGTADGTVQPGAVYVILEDVFGHAATAREAGAEIVFEPTAQEYGGSNYTARDPEGNIWSFGDYNPWAV